MVKQPIEPAAEIAVVTKEPSRPAKKKEACCAVGFYCYIGPSIAGLIQSGSIFRGSHEQALAAAAAAIEKQPLVRNLIVPGDALPQARLAVKRRGNALFEHYRKIVREK